MLSDARVMVEAETHAMLISREVRDFAMLDCQPRNKEVVVKIQMMLNRRGFDNIRVKYMFVDIFHDYMIFLCDKNAVWKVDKMIEAKEKVENNTMALDDYHRTLGKLFGYSDNAIERFIKRCRQ